MAMMLSKAREERCGKKEKKGREMEEERGEETREKGS